MKTISDNVRTSLTLDGNIELTLSLTGNKADNMNGINALNEIIKNGKKLSVEIKQHRIRRSLDANAMLWVMLDKMAQALRTIKDEIYLQMLDRYGVFTHIVVKPEVVERVKQEWRTVRELGEIIVNGKTGIQLQCYFGSSTYNTKEFSVLLDGVINEAKELGIDTMSDAEKESLIKDWGKR